MYDILREIEQRYGREIAEVVHRASRNVTGRLESKLNDAYERIDTLVEKNRSLQAELDYYKNLPENRGAKVAKDLQIT